MRIRQAISKLTGRKHNWLIKVFYKIPGDAPFFKTVVIGLTHPYFINDTRQIKQCVGPDFIKDIPKICRRNGKMEIELINYLGWF